MEFTRNAAAEHVAETPSVSLHRANNIFSFFISWMDKYQRQQMIPAEYSPRIRNDRRETSYQQKWQTWRLSSKPRPKTNVELELVTNPRMRDGESFEDTD